MLSHGTVKKSGHFLSLPHVTPSFTRRAHLMLAGKTEGIRNGSERGSNRGRVAQQACALTAV